MKFNLDIYTNFDVDVWSCGVMLYVFLFGTLPFHDENIPNPFKKIKVISNFQTER